MQHVKQQTNFVIGPVFFYYVTNMKGFSNLNQLSGAHQKHSESHTHVRSCLQLKLFGKQTVDLLLDGERRNVVTRHNEQVEKNKRIVRRFVDAVCSLANQEFPFRRGQDEHPHP